MKRHFDIKELTHGKLMAMIVSAMFFGGVFMWFFLGRVITAQSLNFSAIRENDQTKPFIKPLLAYNTPEIQTANPLRETLKSNISSNVSLKKADVISVYYRDLNTGHWFGINQDETFVPASLFKVPLMITYLKDAEKNKNLLSNEIYDDLTQDENKNETIKPLKSVIGGESYTVEQLLNYMIEYSDNNATVLLFKNINQNTLKDVFSDLDIQVPEKGVNEDFITVGNYSFFFRILYNATYLNHEMSEKGLEILNKTSFKDGITKIIPSNTNVSHKFGEYFLIDGGATKQHQLHDCGIIYHPRHPYLLCVMTKGDSLSELEKVIQSISEVTYKAVDGAR